MTTYVKANQWFGIAVLSSHATLAILLTQRIPFRYSSHVPRAYPLLNVMFGVMTYHRCEIVCNELVAKPVSLNLLNHALPKAVTRTNVYDATYGGGLRGFLLGGSTTRSRGITSSTLANPKLVHALVTMAAHAPQPLVYAAIQARIRGASSASATLPQPRHAVCGARCQKTSHIVFNHLLLVDGTRISFVFFVPQGLTQLHTQDLSQLRSLGFPIDAALARECARLQHAVNKLEGGRSCNFSQACCGHVISIECCTFDGLVCHDEDSELGKTCHNDEIEHACISITDMVQEFHDASHIVTPCSPTLPPADRQRLRVKLLTEEVNELERAFVTSDLIEVADAITDILYVLVGSVLECGLHACLPALFREVHASNMTKFCNDIQTAQAACNEYFQERQVKVRPQRSWSGMYALVRSDGKIVKPMHFKPPKIQQILADAAQNHPTEGMALLAGDGSELLSKQSYHRTLVDMCAPHDSDCESSIACLVSCGVNPGLVSDISQSWYPCMDHLELTDNQVHRERHHRPLWNALVTENGEEKG
eukprot:2698483-Amphidinium_carterae.4